MRGIAVLVMLVLNVCGTVALNAQVKPARIALLIGNMGYTTKVGPLKNPHHDVDRIAGALTGLGFKVTVVKDANYRTMDASVRRYVDEIRRAGPGAISFFYYSGHGAANPENHINYLIPVDVTSADTTEFWYQSFEQSSVIDRLSKRAPNATHFVVFDACRNELNVTVSLKKGLGDEKGFVPVNDVRGMLIAYATGDKRTASDSGMFAKILAEELPQKGVEAVEMFRRVQLRMQKTLNQEPWMSLRYLPPVYLGGAPQAEILGNDTDAKAAREWANLNMNSIAMLETFLRRHGTSQYAAYAQAKLKELKRSKTAVVTPSIKPQVPQNLARALQAELKRVGCYAIEIDGVWGPGSRRALASFQKHAKLSLSTDMPTQKTLLELKKTNGTVCSSLETDFTNMSAGKAHNTVPRKAGKHCRRETWQECVIRVCPPVGKGCGLRGSGICRGHNRKIVCD